LLSLQNLYNMNNQLYLRNVASLEYDASRCTGCLMCIEVCPHNVFRMTGRKAEVVSLDSCMECGACALNCIAGALTVKQGVGCASAVITGYLKKGEPTCSCGGNDKCC